jgi:diacylglycerol kinase family enzyme
MMWRMGDSRYLLVANPTAQSGKNAARIERARALLDERGLAHEFVATAPAGGTVAVVRDALDDGGFATAIYMGGDGTFAEVAKGILASRRGGEVRLGMLPTGTANDQGKSYGLDSDEARLPANVDVIAGGREARLDVGRLRALTLDGAMVREDLFFDSAGWGISPRVLQLRNEDRRAIAEVPILRDLWRDQLVYAGALLRTFLESYLEDDKFDVQLVADGQALEWRGLTDLIVKGTRIYGGMWIFDEGARHDDGRFEVVPFAGKRDWISKALLHHRRSPVDAEELEKIGLRHSRGLSAARVELDFSEHPGGLPLVAQIDGEEFPATPRVQIEALPRALRLIVPAEHAT